MVILQFHHFGEELETNVFLNVKIRKLSKLRELKDNF